MDWYRFTEGEPVGKLRIRAMQVAWYDMERDGSCFDEDYIQFPETATNAEIMRAIGMQLTRVNISEEQRGDKSRVFLIFDNGEEYELKLQKVSKSDNTSFFNGKKEKR